MRGEKIKLSSLCVRAAPVLAAKEAVFSFWGFPYPHPKSHWQCFGNMKKDLIYFSKPIQTIKSKWDSCKASENNNWSVKLSQSLFLPLLLSVFLSSFQKQPHEYKGPLRALRPVELCAALMSRRLHWDALFLSD